MLRAAKGEPQTECGAACTIRRSIGIGNRSSRADVSTCAALDAALSLWTNGHSLQSAVYSLQSTVRDPQHGSPVKTNPFAQEAAAPSPRPLAAHLAPTDRCAILHPATLAPTQWPQPVHRSECRTTSRGQPIRRLAGPFAPLARPNGGAHLSPTSSGRG